MKLDVNDLVMILGLAILAVGVGMAYLPAGLMVFGAGTIGLGVLGAMHKGAER